jgi:hypothetical protein
MLAVLASTQDTKRAAVRVPALNAFPPLDSRRFA